MSRKEREKKLARQLEIEAEKAAILARRQEKMRPTYQLFKKFTLTLLLTVGVLALGFFINTHLVGISKRLIN